MQVSKSNQERSDFWGWGRNTVEIFQKEMKQGTSLNWKNPRLFKDQMIVKSKIIIQSSPKRTTWGKCILCYSRILGLESDRSKQGKPVWRFSFIFFLKKKMLANLFQIFLVNTYFLSLQYFTLKYTFLLIFLRPSLHHFPTFLHAVCHFEIPFLLPNLYKKHLLNPKNITKIYK